MSTDKSVKKKSNVWIWVLAIVITLGAVVFQRMTGPTHPLTVTFTLNGKEYKTRLERSVTRPLDGLGKQTELKFTIKDLPEDVIIGTCIKRFRSNEPWTVSNTMRTGDDFIVSLPPQPVAGKLSYFLDIISTNQHLELLKDEPVVVRFKDDVPAGILIPHIILMFIAMLLSTLAGLLALAKRSCYLKYAWITVVSLFVGGLVFGPMVQKYAFGSYWSGWPMGGDLTDNKTLLAFIIWLVAVLVARTKKRFMWAILAAVVMLLVYSIPHSVMGSEYDHVAGEIKTGQVQ